MKVSVIIPCHNAAPFVRQTIGSVLEQTRPPDELIVVDDASTDETLDIVRSFGDEVQVHEQDNRNAPRTRNFGADVATGSALMFLDADDVLGPAALEVLVRVVRTRPVCVASCPWYRLELEEGRWVERPASGRHRKPGEAPLDAWLRGWYHPPCSVLWTREAFDQTGGWDPEIASNQDGDLMMRAFAFGVPLLLTRTGTAYYRRLPPSIPSLSDDRRTRRGLESRIEVIARICRMVEDNGSLRTHRPAISTAYDGLIAECLPTHPDLARKCTRLREEFGETRVQALLRRARRKARRIWPPADRPWLTAPGRPNRSNGPMEISYGLPSRSDKGPLPVARRRTPRLSVIIPTHDRADVLPHALENVLAQTMTDFEALVIDDASTDETTEVVARYSDPRVRYLVQGATRGVSAARNRGLDEARGEFIAFLDPDDEWSEDKLEFQLRVLDRADPSTGLVYSGIETVLPSGERRFDASNDRGDIVREILSGHFRHRTSTVMLRRRVVHRTGYFDEAIPAFEDLDYWIRVTTHHDVEFIEEPLVRHQPPPNAESEAVDIEDDLDACLYLYEKNLEVLREHGMAHILLAETVGRALQAGDPDSLRVARRLAWSAFLKRPHLRETLPLVLKTSLAH